LRRCEIFHPFVGVVSEVQPDKCTGTCTVSRKYGGEKKVKDKGGVMEQVKTKSVEPHQRFTLPEVSWDELNEAGAYVERGSGDLYRVPKEALIPGGSPIIHKESTGASRLVQVSRNPFVTTLEARLRCAQHNIEPNF
jgi:hypothetical protein